MQSKIEDDRTDCPAKLRRAITLGHLIVATFLLFVLDDTIFFYDAMGFPCLYLSYWIIEWLKATWVLPAVVQILIFSIFWIINSYFWGYVIATILLARKRKPLTIENMPL